MNIQELVKHIAKKEGLKKQVSVGNIREIVGIISDAIQIRDDGARTLDALYKNGIRRALRKKKK